MIPTFATSSLQTVRRCWLAGTINQNPVCTLTNRARGKVLHAFGRPSFHCPICRYHGPFFSYGSAQAKRIHAMCPGCGALERHRLQWLVLKTLPERIFFAQMRVLHIAPEKFLADFFRAKCRGYVSADISGVGVDHPADITHLSFPDRSFDLVYASHVLEHVQDDRKALREVHRVLNRDGIAILPVPIFSGIETVEYGKPNPHETDHVRQPGRDYYARYGKVFSEMKLYRSADFPAVHQLFIHEDRSHWPTPEMPLRKPMAGEKHEDIVPVCYK